MESTAVIHCMYISIASMFTLLHIFFTIFNALYLSLLCLSPPKRAKYNQNCLIFIDNKPCYRSVMICWCQQTLHNALMSSLLPETHSATPHSVSRSDGFPMSRHSAPSPSPVVLQPPPPPPATMRPVMRFAVARHCTRVFGLPRLETE